MSTTSYRASALLAPIAVLAACAGDPPDAPAPAPAPLATPLPCIATLCAPGGLIADDDTLGGGPPVATHTDDAVVFAWPDLDQTVVTSIGFDGALAQASVPGGFATDVAITSLGREPLVVQSTRQDFAHPTTQLVRPGGVTIDLFGGEKPGAAVLHGELVVSSIAESVHLARVTTDGAVLNLRPTGVAARNAVVVALGDQLVVVANDPQGIFAFNVDPETFAPRQEPARLDGAGEITGDTPPVALALDDVVLVAAPRLGDDVVVTGVFDPALGRFRGPATVVATEAQDRAPALARTAAGAMGICYASGLTDGARGIALQRLDDTGTAPVGAPKILAGGQTCTGGCALAAAGDAFVAMWWECGHDVAGNIMRVQEVPVAAVGPSP